MYSAGKNSGVLKGGALGANRGYVLGAGPLSNQKIMKVITERGCQRKVWRLMT